MYEKSRTSVLVLEGLLTPKAPGFPCVRLLVNFHLHSSQVHDGWTSRLPIHAVLQVAAKCLEAACECGRRFSRADCSFFLLLLLSLFLCCCFFFFFFLLSVNVTVILERSCYFTDFKLAENWIMNNVLRDKRLRERE